MLGTLHCSVTTLVRVLKMSLFRHQERQIHSWGILCKHIFESFHGTTHIVSQLCPVSSPTQGFVEITIKDLESLLHTEVSRLWSKGIISVSADAKATFDSDSNRLVKLGQHLKVNEIILRAVDENGARSTTKHSWKVVRLIFTQSLGLDNLRINQEYGVYSRQQNAVLPFKLVNVCLESKMYHFESLTDGIKNLEVDSQNLPSIYRRDGGTHADVYAIAVECTRIGRDGHQVQHELLMKNISDEKFTLDVGSCHIIEAIGKCRFTIRDTSTLSCANRGNVMRFFLQVNLETQRFTSE
jgi:hypothetical protein